MSKQKGKGVVKKIPNNRKPVQKVYEIDFDKISTLDDVKLILKCFDMKVTVVDGKLTENIEPLFNGGLLKERKTK